MNYWLLKTEPDAYSADDLARDGTTLWDGIENPLARKHLRGVSYGDGVLIYHTGVERACVAVAAIGQFYDLEQRRGDLQVYVDFKEKLARPVTLARIRADPVFAGWDLIRIGRLSVVPTPARMWDRVIELSSANGAA